MKRIGAWLSGSRRYRPVYRSADMSRLLSDAARFWDRPSEDIHRLYDGYRTSYKQRRYAGLLGEKKTLCLEEAFLVHLCLMFTRPATVVEIGTQYGKSTRRIVDSLRALDLPARVICFDIENRMKWCSATEAEVVVEDITGRFRQRVLETLNPAFIFLDAHPYYLLQDVIGSFVKTAEPRLLAVHDCGRGLCNPHMQLEKDDPNITSDTGVWERHVLAEMFGVSDPLSDELDRKETATHRLCIFDTRHGLALIAPRAF